MAPCQWSEVRDQKRRPECLTSDLRPLTSEMNRRKFIQRSAMGGATALLGAVASGCATASRPGGATARVPPFELEETTIVELQRGMASGRFSAEGLARAY